MHIGTQKEKRHISEFQWGWKRGIDIRQAGHGMGLVFVVFKGWRWRLDSTESSVVADTTSLNRLFHCVIVLVEKAPVLYLKLHSVLNSQF